MKHMNRRSFLQGTLASGLTAAMSRKVLSANESVRVAVAGLNGRGGDHIKEFSQIPGVVVTHLIDPDTRTFAKRQKQLRELGKPEAIVLQDVRKAIDAKDVDVVAVATPNHWHSLITVWSCQAGKDVFVEKPCSHNFDEGMRCVQAARKYDRIVQHGTQRRSSRAYQQVAAVVRSGYYGPLRVSRGIVYKLRPGIGNKPECPPPTEVDFDLWLGPASVRPFHTNLVHYNWHWFWDFGNGDIGNQGVHQMDVARWMIPDAKFPKSVVSVGGRFGYTDQGETPNTQIALFDYGPTQLIFEVRGLPTAKFAGDEKNEGNVLHFDHGTIANFRFWPKGKAISEPIANIVSDEWKKPGKGNHYANFIACVRSRNRNDLTADIADGHVSSALCHLANVSYRLGEDIAFQPRPTLGPLSVEASDTFEAAEEHLIKTCGPTVTDGTFRCGVVLGINSEDGNVAGDQRYLSREYRKPFSMPARI